MKIDKKQVVGKETKFKVWWELRLPLYNYLRGDIPDSAVDLVKFQMYNKIAPCVWGQVCLQISRHVRGLIYEYDR